MNDQRYDDLTGQRFGRLVAIRYVRGGNGARWECRCDCGSISVPTRNEIKRGTTVSCGCFARENASNTMTKHGMHRTKEYKAWASMIERCEGSREGYVRRYQDRGISVCAEWRNNFEAFFAHIGPAPSTRHSVDRIKNDQGYKPGNVRWALPVVQGNNRSTNIRIEIDGKSILLSEECKRRGLTVKVVRYRTQHMGWDIDRALSTPVRHRRYFGGN